MSARPTRSGSIEYAAPIVEWRFQLLLAAGFGLRAAAALSADRQVDLHALLELVDRGCSPQLAMRIIGLGQE